MKLIEFQCALSRNRKSLSDETSAIAIAPLEVRRIEKSRLKSQDRTVTKITVGYNKSFFVIGNFSDILSKVNKGLENDNT